MYVCGFALRYSKKVNAPSLESITHLVIKPSLLSTAVQYNEN